MTHFEFFSPVRIIFGGGSRTRLGSLTSDLGRRALVIVNGGQPGDGGRVDELIANLAAAGVAATCCRQRGEPLVADIERWVGVGRAHRCDVVIGLGGGSAIDAAKATAGLLTNPGSLLDYLEVIGRGQRLEHPAAPWIAVPTTAGTGAEATRNAVIGCPDRRFKASLRSELLLAKVTVIDPELGVSAPPDVTAASGLDALCQLIESYVSNRAQPLTDALALHGIDQAAPALPRAWSDGADLDARQAMALAALLSGITLANAGLGAVHGLAAPLGANYPIPHGMICAALLPHVTAANIAALSAQSPDHPHLARYAELGRRLTNAPGLAPRAALDAAPRFLFELAAQLQIPPLSRFGLASADVPAIIALARRSSSMKYNPVTLSDDALAQALDSALRGAPLG